MTERNRILLKILINIKVHSVIQIKKAGEHPIRTLPGKPRGGRSENSIYLLKNFLFNLNFCFLYSNIRANFFY